jgi:hypothetical protein
MPSPPEFLRRRGDLKFLNSSRSGLDQVRHSGLTALTLELPRHEVALPLQQQMLDLLQNMDRGSVQITIHIITKK